MKYHFCKNDKSIFSHTDINELINHVSSSLYKFDANNILTLCEMTYIWYNGDWYQIMTQEQLDNPNPYRIMCKPLTPPTGQIFKLKRC